MKQNESFRIKLKWRVSANGNKYDRAIPFDSNQHSRASSQYLLEGTKQSFMRGDLPFYKPFLTKKKETLSNTFQEKYTLSQTYSIFVSAV